MVLFFGFRDQKVPYEIVRSKKRRRSIALTLNDENIVRVSVPYRTSQKEISGLLEERGSWIVARMASVRAERASRPALHFDEADVVSYLGHACRLHFVVQAGEAGACHLNHHLFKIRLSSDSFSEEDRRNEAETALRLWFKKRSRTLFQKRLDLWARRLGVSYNGFAIGSPNQRWGSCNAQNHIRLNWHLLLAPLPLLDYVVAHELCHVVHKDHSAAFWGFLETVMPDYRLRRTRLRKNTRLYKL